MKKIWLFLVIAGVSSPRAYSWPRLGQGANIVTQNSGDKAFGISVSISSTSATKVYTADSDDREVLLQNTDATYNVHCGTSSAVSAASGQKRWILWAKPAGNFTTNGTYSIWCIAEPGAGSIEVVGSAEYDLKD